MTGSSRVFAAIDSAVATPLSGSGTPQEFFADLRRREFSRLDRRSDVYLDYTGSALYLASHVEWHLQLLADGVFGNPHAENPASRSSTAWHEASRTAILDLLDADPHEYVVVFTANASAAAKLVGESFAFVRRSRLVLSADNHNSVLGLREFARRAGAHTEYIPLDDELRFRDVAKSLVPITRGDGHLLAFPAQSNFSGVRHPLALVRLAQGLGYTVLLDAAAYAPSSPLSLRTVPADFVILSLYKLFGYPTGVGALVARREALSRLRRPWFAGGTVEFSSVQNDLHLLRPDAEGFEDGTPAFLALSAVADGVRRFRELGIVRVHEHVAGLTSRLLIGLQALQHSNGRPALVIHGPREEVGRGGTIAFNLFDRHGRWVPSWEVERWLAARRISVRAGCFCNPGAAERAFGFDAAEARRCLTAVAQGRRAPEPFSLEMFARCLPGHPVGAVRASVGPATNDDDVERLLTALETLIDGAGRRIGVDEDPGEPQCA